MTEAHPTTRATALHAAIIATRATWRAAERELARLLAQLADGAYFRALGFASLADYGRQVLELSPRQTEALARIGRALPSLPVLDAALGDGSLGWTKARELLAVITPENEAAWVARAQQVSSRRLEREVAHVEKGDEPPDPDAGLKGPQRVRLVFELDAVDADVVRDAIAVVRAAAGVNKDEVSDGALLAQLCQRSIADAEQDQAPSGERYRVVLQRCPDCALTTGLDAEVGDTHVGEACCDAEVQQGEGPDAGKLARTVPPATRRAVLNAFGWRCAVPDCANRLWLDVHHRRYRSRGGGHERDNLVPLCSAHHRCVHEGLLAIELVDGRLRVRSADGRERWVRGGGAPRDARPRGRAR